MISVVLLGAGNVATHLYQAFSKAKNANLVQWYNRSLQSIESYKNQVSITDELHQIVEADVYIIAVSDDAVKSLSSSLPFENRLVVHTSGSVGIHDLDKKHRRGVFYPLQTFSKTSELDFKDVPICIETLEKEDFNLLANLAETVGSPYYKINTEQRQTLHLSAVFVNNFTNQLYRVAHEISDAKSIDFDILKPLIMETAKKVQHMSPYTAQTGPAKRNDKKTIKKHLKLLEREDHKAIYELLTNVIKKTHGR
ncbi:coenzyme F420-dependent NADP oxidoreductase-like protein [Flavobacteriaceae bacterium MAR_2010_72]|nr:coenzyme F420-dependent NADP oxidoreductase-like protein [Flavobacteriaceae bacterium MAR_2010_72]